MEAAEAAEAAKAVEATEASTTAEGAPQASPMANQEEIKDSGERRVTVDSEGRARAATAGKNWMDELNKTQAISGKVHIADDSGRRKRRSKKKKSKASKQRSDSRITGTPRLI